MHRWRIRIFKIIPLIIISFFIAQIELYAETTGNVEGYWKSIDNKTQEATAYWHLFVKDEILYGYLVTYPDMKPNEVCDKCKGEFKNKPQLGTPWLMLKKLRNDNVWEDGYVVDSGKGKYYRARVWVEDGTLKVRGYVSFFYETQEWIRATKEEAENGF